MIKPTLAPESACILMERDGGPAFPVTLSVSTNPPVELPFPGISVWELCSMLTLASILSLPSSGSKIEACVDRANDIADAWLAARQERKQDFHKTTQCSQQTT